MERASGEKPGGGRQKTHTVGPANRRTSSRIAFGKNEKKRGTQKKTKPIAKEERTRKDQRRRDPELSPRAPENARTREKEREKKREQKKLNLIKAIEKNSTPLRQTTMQMRMGPQTGESRSEMITEIHHQEDGFPATR